MERAIPSSAALATWALPVSLVIPQSAALAPGFQWGGPMPEKKGSISTCRVSSGSAPAASSSTSAALPITPRPSLSQPTAAPAT